MKNINNLDGAGQSSGASEWDTLSEMADDKQNTVDVEPTADDDPFENDFENWASTYYPKMEGESAEDYSARINKMRESIAKFREEHPLDEAKAEVAEAKPAIEPEPATEQETVEPTPQPEASDQEPEFGAKRILVGGSEEKEIDTKEYLVYSCSDREKEAVPRENLLDFLEDKLDKTENSKQFGETFRLMSQIRTEYKDDAEMISKIDEIEKSDEFKTKRLTSELESKKKFLEKRTEALERCQAELDRLKSASFKDRLINFRERKTAQDRYNWTKKDIDDAQRDIERIETDLKELNGGELAEAA